MSDNQIPVLPIGTIVLLKLRGAANDGRYSEYCSSWFIDGKITVTDVFKWVNEQSKANAALIEDIKYILPPPTLNTKE